MEHFELLGRRGVRAHEWDGNRGRGPTDHHDPSEHHGPSDHHDHPAAADHHYGPSDHHDHPAAADHHNGPSDHHHDPAATVSGGKPDAGNTGVPAGTSLSPSGTITVTTPGAVISNKLVTGCILVRASNVTIKNTKIMGGCSNGIDIEPWSTPATNLTIQDTEIDGQGADNCIAFYNFTAIRVDLHNCVDGAKVGDNTTIQDSWIHDLATPPGAHSDALQTTGGNGTTVTHSVLGGPMMMGDEFGPLANVTIQGSWLDGGLWGGWNQSTGTRPSNMRVLSNTINTPIVYVSPDTTWTNNTTPSGAAIQHP